MYSGNPDGTAIEGIPIKPADYDPHAIPLLVIHGGPTGVDSPCWPPTAITPSRLCAKGALVLKPNYRGSAGYGEKFRASTCAISASAITTWISGVDS